MSTKAQVKTQAKTPAAPVAGHIPLPKVAAPEHEAERPDIAAQIEGAARLGHSFGALGVDGAGPTIIQRQEIPEEEEEELQLKREPAAVQRQEIPEEEEEELMMKRDDQRVGPQGGQAPPEVAAAIHRARGGGRPLEPALQAQMSEAMGYDFSGVRVHTGPEADELNQELSASAFTTGQDIFFRQGVYNPGSTFGRALIAHELTHVVQQRSARVSGSGSGMTVRPAGDPLEQAADEQGWQVAVQRAGAHAPVPTPASVAKLPGQYGVENSLPARTLDGGHPLQPVIQRRVALVLEPANAEAFPGSLLLGTARTPSGQKAVTAAGKSIKLDGVRYTHAGLYEGDGKVFEYHNKTLQTRSLQEGARWRVAGPPRSREVLARLDQYLARARANPPRYRGAKSIKVIKWPTERGKVPKTSYCADIVGRAIDFAVQGKEHFKGGKGVGYLWRFALGNSYEDNGVGVGQGTEPKEAIGAVEVGVREGEK
jgi:hypothetical protein